MLSYMNTLPIRLLQYIINMLDGIDQLHFKMTCKNYRNNIYITKPHDIVNHIIRNKTKDVIQYSNTGDQLFVLKYDNNKITIHSYGTDEICYKCKRQQVTVDCDQCNKAFCNDCYDVECDICGKLQCPICYTFQRCYDKCLTYCDDCKDSLIECTDCNSIFCRDCDDYININFCNSCWKTECIDCTIYEVRCYYCSYSLCDECKDNNDLVICNNDICEVQVCRDCYDICNTCKKSYCNSCIEDHYH